MIPYVEQPSLHIVGPITIYPFGVMMLIGFLVAFYFSAHRARQAGVHRPTFVGAQRSCAILIFLVGHLAEVLLYQRARLIEEGPILLINIFDGISSYGGFVGGTIGFSGYWLLKRREEDWLVPSECLLQGAVMGWVFGRFGCTLAHDHPGQLSDFFLAVQYPGGSRHDLGLYELLFTGLVMIPVLLWLHRRRSPRGSYAAVTLLLYGPARFLLDFLRLEAELGGDPRYHGLTPAQYASLVFTGGGVAWAIRLRRNRRRGPAGESAVTVEEG